ncbi:MAG TPA: TonB-dependent receptor [Rhizomicrobium sp.]|jgi:outer membrane receptor protein involved in Fe transport
MLRSSRFAFLASVSLFAIVMGSYGASAQSQDVEQVEVTGTHIVRDGYQAPTPVTVLDTEYLKAAAPANIADVVTQLPSVVGSTTNQNTNQSFSAGQDGVVTVNLRNLGANRTLVLLDGMRSVPSSVTGIIDVDTIPQELVSRVDVVTGGASAVYGSDALAGVVNFVLDKDYTGLKGELSGGITTYGDDANYRMSLTAGTPFAGGRGHFIFNVSTDHVDGIFGNLRAWDQTGKYFLTNPSYKAGNGQPQYLIESGAGFSTGTPGGIITSGPLKGVAFGPGGTPYQFNYGSLESDPFCVGGSCTANQDNQGVTLDQANRRGNVFSRVSYDVTDHINVYLQASYNQSTSVAWDVSTFSLANQTLSVSNPYLPASVKAEAVALGVASFTMGTFWGDLPPLSFKGTRDTTRSLLGASGDFDLFGSNWKWEAHAQYGFTATSENGYALNTTNAALAIDAVASPTTGAIVCRSTLTNPNNGCVPYDIFGTGVNSKAAVKYVDGNGSISYRHQGFTEKTIGGGISGEPFEDWAGPVSLAFGIEDRSDSVHGAGDPLSVLHQWYSGNYLPLFGAVTVTEGYVETVIPVAKDLPFAESLDFNIAARETGYTTSGNVTTFKFGVEYQPIDDIRFRGTRSRDIRAPNVSELFAAGTSGTNNVTDPFLNRTYSDLTITKGNPDLKPEVATTNSVGAVFTPTFLPGFNASVDYYNINIDNGIGSLSGQQIVTNCYQGETSYCSAIQRDPTSGLITVVNAQPFNLASQEADGIDFEASYSGQMSDFNATWNGSYNIRGLATHYLKNYSNNGLGTITDTVGQNQNETSNTSFGPPNWSWLTMLTYVNRPFSGTFTMRGISAGVYANNNYSLVGCASACPVSTTTSPTVNDNHVPGSFYMDVSVNYEFGPLEFFAVVKNLMDKDPPILAPGTGVPNISQTNVSLYDTLGRNYRAGIRFNF